MRPNTSTKPVNPFRGLAPANAPCVGSPELDFAAVVEVHGRALYGRALWLTKTETDAADLFQDTIERALAAPPKQHRDSALVMRWLLTIMHNSFLDDCRAKATRRTVSESDLVLERLEWRAPAKPACWRMVTDDVLRACVARLTRNMQEMFAMYAAGASYAMLARHFQIPGSTVGTRLLRMRRRLRRLLQEILASDNPW
jgi:RNA polymerase sigma-70 factor (ECF subfamily)